MSDNTMKPTKEQIIEKIITDAKRAAHSIQGVDGKMTLHITISTNDLREYLLSLIDKQPQINLAEVEKLVQCQTSLNCRNPFDFGDMLNKYRKSIGYTLADLGKFNKDKI
jgi:hypothetical protein